MNNRCAIEIRLRALAPIFVALLLTTALSGQQKPAAPITGFVPARVEAERQLEQKLLTIPDPAQAERNLRRITREPHLAGTEASYHLAQWLRDQYRSFGFDAEIVSFTVWLPMPRDIELEMTKPQYAHLASPEPPIADDPDTSDKRAVVAYNTYSPSGEVTAPVVYVNYGMPEDYRQLDALGISVAGKIVIARYGHSYRGIKAKLAEEHKAAGLILYSDPQDDGYVVGDTYPWGPMRPMRGVQRGSILYTQIYPGDPLAPDTSLAPNASRLSPADAANLPHIPAMPISAADASILLSNLAGPRVPSGWQGGLPFSYHIGPGATEAHMKIALDYSDHQIYDVIAKLQGSSDDEWVVLGNHHDAWVFGAADPGSGTATMLETARALGQLVKSGWKPRRTIVICHWDGEEPGLLGSTAWVAANRATLQAKAVAYINTDIGVSGPNLMVSAVPSLSDMIRDATREVADPETGMTVYDAWRAHPGPKNGEHGSAPSRPASEAAGAPPVGSLGAGSDFCAFLDYAGIPSVDLGFEGEYGVYHSLYDDFGWMKGFGDPQFTYHAALARVIGILALRLDGADILPYDYAAYAAEISGVANGLASRVGEQPTEAAALKPVVDAAAQFSDSAARASQALRALGSQPLDPAKAHAINLALASVEQALLAPQGLLGRTWYKHTVFAPGSYAGYAAEVLPGVSEALDRGDAPGLQHEADSLAAALRRAAARLDDVTRLAQSTAPR